MSGDYRNSYVPTTTGWKGLIVETLRDALFEALDNSVSKNIITTAERRLVKRSIAESDSMVHAYSPADWDGYVGREQQRHEIISKLDWGNNGNV